ncbi:GNAT family N-acetyltransferase [Pelistega ratti]|uniref:GNAT family N-acetyltransferase n=1 Tax=Pelistega ratti TaxID=2652177 RepID=UPI0013599AC2|nr:GNAT family N-acetyltransferase [Pelistega ratti]
MVIRPAILLDIPQILDLQRICYEVAFQEDSAAFSSKINQPDSLCWVVEKEGELLAYFMAIATNRERFPCLNTGQYDVLGHTDILYLHDMAISPQARGQGLLKQLLAKVWQQAEQLMLKEAFLIAVQGSSNMWASKGFIVVEAKQYGLEAQLRTYGEGAVLMYKKIGNSVLK